jgi:hypothetical protein
MMHAFAHHLQRFSLGHSGVIPLDLFSGAAGGTSTNARDPAGSVVAVIEAFNGLFRIEAGSSRHVHNAVNL